jgi:drug/metabolite transporter (DMT)-like permease
LGNLLYLGLIASLFCFWAFNIGMARIGIVTTNNYGYLTPVVTFISAIVVLGDDFTAIGAIGVVITLAGLYLAQKKTN